MSASTFPDISIQFSENSIILLNICLGFVMFGIALGIKPKDFKLVVQKPKSALIGLMSQFLFLPAITFVLVYFWQPAAPLALGMILVASCPGGNISNFISSLSGANIALSVALTGLATLITPILTPLNFEFWSHALLNTSTYLQTFKIDFLDIFQTVFLLLVFPLIAGLFVSKKFQRITKFIEIPIRILSILILMVFIVIALKNNFETFVKHIYIVFLLVFIHNALAFILGYIIARAAKLPPADRRTICIETGIQNSGLGLIIIFTFFDGNGGMAIIAAWWGIWHIVTGLGLSYYFKNRDQKNRKKKKIECSIV